MKHGTVTGYVNPLFQGVDVYDTDQDQDKALFQQLYEGVVGGAITVLSNKADVSGKVVKPQTSTWRSP